MSAQPDTGPSVYIVEVQPFDYSPAEAFGRLVPMNIPPLHPGNIGIERNREVLAAIRNILTFYRPGYDWIVPTGKPALMMVVGQVLGGLGDRHKYLMWEPYAYRYIPLIADGSIANRGEENAANAANS